MNVKGKKEGEYRRFYRNGELKYLCHFENNRREGQLEMYYPNGSLWRTEEFRKGRSQGGHVYNAAGNEIEFYPSERIVGFQVEWMRWRFYERACALSFGSLGTKGGRTCTCTIDF